MATAKASVKAKKEEATVEVAGVEMETQTLEQAQPQKVNVLLHRFSREDLDNGDTRIFERFYKTFETMGIEGDRDRVFDLMDMYFDWFAVKQEEFKAEKDRKRQEAQDRIRKLAEQAGIEIQIA